MPINVGSADKTAWVIVTFIIAVLGIVSDSWWGLLALIPFFTVVTGWSPLYSLLRISTCLTNK